MARRVLRVQEMVCVGSGRSDGAVGWAAWAQYRLAREQPPQRRPGDKVEAHWDQNAARELACSLLGTDAVPLEPRYG